MVSAVLCLTLVALSGADPNSLTWFPGLTLDLPHHSGGNLGCWAGYYDWTLSAHLVWVWWDCLPIRWQAIASACIIIMLSFWLLVPCRVFCPCCSLTGSSWNIHVLLVYHGTYWLRLLKSSGQFNLDLDLTLISFVMIPYRTVWISVLNVQVAWLQSSYGYTVLWSE